MRAGWLVGLGLVASGCGDNVTPCDRTEVGTICTIAGNGENGYDGEGGPALEARLSLPMDMIAAPDGDLYVADWNNHRIRRVTPDGIIEFVVGNGELGGSIDDPATGDLNHPPNLVFDPSGTVIHLAAWHNSKVMVLDPLRGELTEQCGDGRRAYFGDDSDAITASLDLPAAVAFSPQGELVVLDQANQVIRMIDTNGVIRRLAGQCVIDAAPPNGPGACATGVAPTPCPAPSGKFTCGDPATTCGIPCTPGYNGDGVAASEMRMAQVFGQAADPGGRLAFDSQGRLYFADVTNQIIRRIDPDGTVQRVAGLPPQDGVKQPGYSGDGGPATQARLNHPIDLAFDDQGTMYITDVFNHCVRAISPDGIIRTVVGVCTSRGYAGDGGLATEALLNRPYGIEWVAPNTLYVADTGNSVIRAVTLP